ncbi:unnamed protein product [Aphis gossypii]|uniref:Uncharacterized protein n=1 Tax=Aphis gossypii TaxID=80765 RepID=A0A9P0IK19_APHGO|nr:unnamed protein product [Aphis gossypii]
MTVRVVGAVLRADAGRIPLVRVPERLGRHLMRAVRVVGTVGRREAGRVTGLGVRRRDQRLTVVIVGRLGRMVLVTGTVILAGVVVVVVGVVVVVIVAGRRLGVRGQQHVVAVRIVGTQGRIQSGRISGAAGQRSRGLDGENDSLSVQQKTICHNISTCNNIIIYIIQSNRIIITLFKWILRKNN